MTVVKLFALAALTSIVTTVLFVPRLLNSTEEAIIEEPVTVVVPALTHAQDTWMRALEWCESRGNPEAVNEMDLDGTPSYGAWQFKPDTFWYYADKYGVETDTVAEALESAPLNLDGSKTIRAAYYDRHEQERVLTAMLLHYDEINWHQQFPACVRKLGLPPRAPVQ